MPHVDTLVAQALLDHSRNIPVLLVDMDRHHIAQRYNPLMEVEDDMDTGSTLNTFLNH